MSDQVTGGAPARKVGILLAIGIFLLPIVFAWFTLRKGHSTVARIISFVWLAVVVVVWIAGSQGTSPASSPKIPAPVLSSETAGVAPAQSPAEPKAAVSMANYARLETGMSYADVVAILGKPGTELSSNEIGGTRTVMYQWDGRFGANMNAMFQDDKMIQKAQFGLR